MNSNLSNDDTILELLFKPCVDERKGQFEPIDDMNEHDLAHCTAICTGNCLGLLIE